MSEKLELRDTHLDDIGKRRSQPQTQTQSQRAHLGIKPALPTRPCPDEDDDQGKDTRDQSEGPDGNPFVFCVWMEERGIGDGEKSTIAVDLV